MKILIDYGHGKDTPGKRSPWSAHGTEPELPFFEWQWNREVGKMILAELRNQGLDVSEVVSEDKDISLATRVSRINKVCKELGTKNVILISIHSNAAGNGKQWYSARGWSCYTTKGQTESDTLSEFLYTEAEKFWYGQGGLKVRKDKSDGDRDWEANFYIIYHSLCPAVLTENFFYDNIDDCSYILSDSGKKAVVACHVSGIMNYINSKKKK